MRQFLALLVLLFLGASTAIAHIADVPQVGNSGTTITVADLNHYDGFAFSPAANIQRSCLLPGIVFTTTSNNNNSAAFITSGRQKQTVFHGTGQAFERIKPMTAATMNYGNKDGDFWDVTQLGRQQRVNSDQIFVLPQATKDGNEGGNSATTTIGAYDEAPHDIGWQNLANHFFLNICVEQQTSAPTSGFYFRC